MTNDEKLRKLVAEWREAAEPLQTQTHDPVRHRGDAIAECAYELEQVIEDD